MNSFFIVCLFIIGAYELSKVVYPNFESEIRLQIRTLKEHPVIEMETCPKDKVFAMVPGQRLVKDGVDIARIQYTPEYIVYICINCIYMILSILPLFSFNPAYIAGFIGLTIMSFVMCKAEPTKAVVRIDALISIFIIINVLYVSM